jgi:DNA segregation ATPase FtsK/SpoIIIE-like protein
LSIDIGDEAIPGGLICAPSRSGKTVLVEAMLWSLKRNSPALDIYLIDAKGGAEYSKEIRESLTLIDIPSDSKRAFNSIQKLHRELRERFAFKARMDLVSMREGWCSKVPGCEKYRPCVIVVDEASRLLLKKSGNSDFDTACEALRILVIDCLKLFASIGTHIVLVTQSARAGELTMLEGGQDAFAAGYIIYGKLKPSMASEVGHPEVAKDSEVGSLKGAFFLDYRSRLMKFRTVMPGGKKKSVVNDIKKVEE